MLLAASFVVLLMLPLAAFIRPSQIVTLPILQRDAIVALPDAVVGIGGAIDDSPLAVEAPIGVLRTDRAWRGIAVSTLLLTGWAIGVLICFFPVAAGLWHVRRIRQNGVPWCSPCRILGVIADQMPKRVELILHENVPGPVTFDFIRPAVVFPPDAPTWSRDDLRRAMTHELEHVRRGDWAILCMARLVCVLYWFHSLVWIAWRQLRLEAEHACDDGVVGQSEPAVYADQLVMLAQRLAAKSDRSLLAMAGGGDLATRVRAVLDTDQERGRAGALACVATALAGLVIGGAIAPLRAIGVAEPLAQRAEAANVTFEVASVKPNKTGARAININTLPGGRFVATNVPVRSLIRIAYGLEDHQIVGGPSWISTDPFDIEAIAGRDLPEMNGPFGAGGALPDMLKSLLAERFGLVSHVEVRESPVFHLVMARDDRRLGDDMKRSAIDCAALFAQRKPGEGSPPCGVRIAPGSIVLEGVPVSQLALALTGFLRRPVIDRTNLEGTYDLQLNWQMRQPPPPDAPPAAAPEGRTLFTALEDAAGMRLENARGPQQVLIIDSVHQPSPN